MKNILSRWILLLLSAIILPACSDSDNPAMPESPESPPKEPISLFKRKITKRTWKGEYGYFCGPSLTVDFNPDGNGTMIYDDHHSKKTKNYRFTYQVNEPYIECHGTLISNRDKDKEVDMDMAFELRDNRLFPLSEDYKMFVLGADEIIRTNSYGVIINDISIYGEHGVDKVWINENGLNIIDLREFFDGRTQAVQLCRKGEKYFDFYADSDVDNPAGFVAFNQEEYVIKSGSLLWRIIDCTGDKLTLLGDDGLETYYPADPSVMPQITDVDEILSSTNEWREYNPEYGHHFHGTEWNFNSDGTFSLHTNFKGTYSHTDNEIIFYFTKADVGPGFNENDIAPITWISPLKIRGLGSFTFEVPKYGFRTVYGIYDKEIWHL